MSGLPVALALLAAIGVALFIASAVFTRASLPGGSGWFACLVGAGILPVLITPVASPYGKEKVQLLVLTALCMYAALCIFRLFPDEGVAA